MPDARGAAKTQKFRSDRRATGEFVNIDYALAVLVHTLACRPATNWCCLPWRARSAGSRMPANNCAMAG
jgi:hypothetical protein